jgi:hypothetical protein
MTKHLPNPLTHLLWGYLISHKLTKDPRLVLLGLTVSVLPDIDILIPWTLHRGFLHTPIFGLVVVGSLYGASRSKPIALICAAAFASHLLMDAVASANGLMWMFPIIDGPASQGLAPDVLRQIVIRTFLFATPLVALMPRGDRTTWALQPIKLLIEGLHGRTPAKATVLLFLVAAIAMVSNFYLTLMG